MAKERERQLHMRTPVLACRFCIVIIKPGSERHARAYMIGQDTDADCTWNLARSCLVTRHRSSNDRVETQCW